MEIITADGANVETSKVVISKVYSFALFMADGDCSLVYFSANGDSVPRDFFRFRNETTYKYGKKEISYFEEFDLKRALEVERIDLEK